MTTGVVQQTRHRVQRMVANTPPGTWAKAGVGVLVAGVGLGWLAFPYILDKVVAMQINLSQGNDARRLWTQLPTVDSNIYIFNITNPSEVMQGAKPEVREVGPYCYKVMKDKTNIVEDPSTDTLSYSARATWYESQTGLGCSAPELSGEEMLVVPNIPMLAILLVAEKDFPPAMLAAVNQALPSIFGRVSDVFLRVSARQLLFGGIHINCSARALFPRAVCIALKQNSRGLKKLGNDQYSFSFFGLKNNTPEEFRYTVKRGTENVEDIGRLVALDGKAELPFWRGECNKIQGTDGSVFPPFRLRENGSLSAYASEICKTLVGTYEGDVDYKGITGYAYSTIFADIEGNPGERCFCPTDSRCRKRGVIDVLKCQGAPVVVSHPHFYLGSQEYVDGVTGLNPNKEKHGIILALEPISGSPLIVRKRLQLNIDLKPISFITVTQRLRRTLTPLVWVEELLDLDENLVGVLEASLFRPIRIVDVIKWMALVSGVGLGVGAAVLKYRNSRRDQVHVLKEGFGYEDNVKPSTIDEGDGEKREINEKTLFDFDQDPLKYNNNHEIPKSESILKGISTEENNGFNKREDVTMKGNFPHDSHHVPIESANSNFRRTQNIENSPSKLSISPSSAKLSMLYEIDDNQSKLLETNQRMEKVPFSAAKSSDSNSVREFDNVFGETDENEDNSKQFSDDLVGNDAQSTTIKSEDETNDNDFVTEEELRAVEEDIINFNKEMAKFRSNFRNNIT